MSKCRKKSLFKKALTSWFIILIVLSLVALAYVFKCLVDYNSNDIDIYMTSLVNDLKLAAKKGSISKYIPLADINSEYEDKSSLGNGYKELLNDDHEVKYVFDKKASDKKNHKLVYNVYSDDKLVVTVKLDNSVEKTALAILTYNELKREEMVGYNNEGLYSYDITVREADTLYINGIAAKDNNLVSNSQPLKEYEDVADIANIPRVKTYKINNLTKKPKIEIKDKDGNIVTYQTKDNVITTDYIKVSTLDEAKKYFAADFNPIDVAHNYSLFFTNDLTLYNLSKNMIRNSQVYRDAQQWLNQVDRSFTSSHRTPSFENDKLSNFIIYDENNFSVDVYTEEVFTLTRTGEKIVNPLEETYYFTYYNGVYCLVHK